VNDLGHQTFSLFMALFENLQVFRAHSLLHDDRFLELWNVWMKCEKEGQLYLIFFLVCSVNDD
jgi:hypothetical protein